MLSQADIKYSYKATEQQSYEYAKFLMESGLDVELLITKTTGGVINKDYVRAKKRYAKLPKRYVDCTEVVLPFNYHLFVYRDLPKDSLIYMPYGIYQYLFNVMTKPRGQKYIIGCHGMHLRFGQVIEGHRLLDGMVNSTARFIMASKGDDARNMYFHVINKVQIPYLVRLGVKRENIIYVPTMLDTNKYKIASNQTRRLRVVHVGGTGKNSGTLLEIIKILIDRGEIEKFEFFFVWHEQPAELHSYARERQNIHLLGDISDAEKTKLLSQMDVMIVPAVETFSKTMIEGITSGLYIMASKRNPASLDVRDLGVDMTITEKGMPEEYIKPLLKAANAKARLGRRYNPNKKRDREIVVRNFDQNNVLPKLLKMFTDVMDTK